MGNIYFGLTKRYYFAYYHRTSVKNILTKWLKDDMMILNKLNFLYVSRIIRGYRA